MAELPARCTRCGEFFASGFAATGANMTFVGNKAGPCPRCGGEGKVPDGTYDLTEDTIALITGPAETVDDLRLLADILARARAEGGSRERIVEDIRRDAPAFSGLARLLPQDRIEVIGYLGLILTAVGAAIDVITSHGTQTVSLDSETIRQISEAVKAAVGG